MFLLQFWKAGTARMSTVLNQTSPMTFLSVSLSGGQQTLCVNTDKEAAKLNLTTEKKNKVKTEKYR